MAQVANTVPRKAYLCMWCVEMCCERLGSVSQIRSGQSLRVHGHMDQEAHSRRSQAQAQARARVGWLPKVTFTLLNIKHANNVHWIRAIETKSDVLICLVTGDRSSVVVGLYDCHFKYLNSFLRCTWPIMQKKRLLYMLK